jgi:hypothetical protein
MPATDLEVKSFQNMTTKESKWHPSPTSRKRFICPAIVSAFARGRAVRMVESEL